MKKIEYKQGINSTWRLIIPVHTLQQYMNVLLTLKNNTDVMMSGLISNETERALEFHESGANTCIMIGTGVSGGWFIYNAASSVVDNNRNCMIPYEEFMQTYGVDPIEELLKQLDKAEQQFKQ